MLTAKHSANPVRGQFFWLVLLAFVCSYFTYSATVTIPAYHHDTYKFSTGTFHRACSSNQGNAYMRHLGRPIGAWLDCMNYRMGNSLAHLNRTRYLCLIAISLLLALVTTGLRSAGFRLPTAFLLAGSVTFLPAYATVMLMASTTIIIAALLALLSSYLLFPWDRPAKQISLYNIHVRHLFGVVFLFAAMFTYASAAAFFLVPVFIRVMFAPLSEWRATGQQVVRDVFIYSVLCLYFYLRVRHMQFHGDISSIPASYRLNLNTHLFGRVMTLFFHKPTLWNMDATRLQFYTVYGVITAGCAIAFKQFWSQPQKSFVNLLQAIAAVVVLSMSASIIYLAAPTQDVPLSRIVFVFQTFQLIALFWSCNYIAGLFPRYKAEILLASAGLLFCLGAAYANRLVTMSALNDNLELNFIVNSLTDAMVHAPHIDRIHVIASRNLNYNGQAPHEDIYNINSTYYKDDTTNIINAALLTFLPRHSFSLTDCVTGLDNQDINCVLQTRPDSIAVTHSTPDQELKLTPNTLVIDMNGRSWFNAV
jgi:hypothetical protein